jgi:glycosyltransferase involved in cell wall biosynthesis
MKVALVHYWLIGMRGGERVLEALAELYPEADIFCLVADFDKLSPALRKRRIQTSFLQKIGGVKFYQKMLPLMPAALESFDLTEYDLVISSEAGPAKGVITRPDAIHICYCHSPMRYIWDLAPQYYAAAGTFTKLFMRLTGSWLRTWDVTTSARVDHFIANSEYVAKRLWRFYRRESIIVNPPVDLSRFTANKSPEAFYICAGQITPYKRIDLAIETFTKLGLPLVVIGAGATAKMKASAGENITFVGSLSDGEMADYFSKCRALVFPGLEDFGIVPLEVMASGRPVVAYGRGGACETVIPGQTGLLFDTQSVESLSEAILEMEKTHSEYSPDRLRAFAAQFDKSKFSERLKQTLDNLISDMPKQPPRRIQAAIGFKRR